MEAARCYRCPARISRPLLLRQEALSKPIRDSAWKAQLRLCARYRKFVRTGKPTKLVAAAMARELAGFVWAIARQCRCRRPNREKAVIADQGAASRPSDTLLPGKAGGAVAARRTLASTICRILDPTQVPRPRQLREASTVMRFQPAR